MARSEDSDINGKTPSSIVESLSHAILQAGVRTTHFAAAFKALVKCEGERHRNLGAKAEAFAGMYPPAIALKIEEANSVAARIAPGSITCVDEETGQYLVPPGRHLKRCRF